MNTFQKTSLVIGAVISFVAPVIPEDMTFVVAYESPCSAFVNATTDMDVASSTGKTLLPYIPETCDGSVAVAVFADDKGNKLSVEIPVEQLHTMWGFDGAKLNPTYTEYESVLESLMPTVDAAVVRTAHTNLVTNSGASVNSITFAVNCLGGTSIIVSSYNEVNTAGNTTGVTYNAVATTAVGAIARPGQNRQISLWAKHSPDSGSNNVVITRATTATSKLSGAAACYSGTDILVAIPTVTANDAKSSNASGVSSITITLANNSGAAVYGIYQTNDGPGQTAGTGMTILSSEDISSEFTSSPEPGNASQAVTGNSTAAGADMDMIVMALEAQITAGGDISSDFIPFQ